MFITTQVDVFILQNPPQPFHKPVVHPPSTTIHAHQHSGFLHRPDIVDGRELSSLIGVGNQRRLVPPARASCQPWTQNAASSVMLNSQASTNRLHQSITTIRYMNPCRIGR